MQDAGLFTPCLRCRAWTYLNNNNNYNNKMDLPVLGTWGKVLIYFQLFVVFAKHGVFKVYRCTGPRESVVH
jgi:hypothetical protein